MMPLEKFRDGSIQVSMLTYALSENISKNFDFSWDKGIYREMVRRAIKKAKYEEGKRFVIQLVCSVLTYTTGVTHAFVLRE